MPDVTRDLAERTIDKLVKQGKVRPCDRDSRVASLESELERHDRRMALKFFRSVVAAAAAASVAVPPSR